MIEETARVLGVDMGTATVSVLRQSACGNCAAGGGCGTNLLASWLPQRRLTFRLPNDIDARPGDTVLVGLDERALQRYALLIYATPLAGLMFGAIAGSWLAGMLRLGPELLSVTLGLLGLVGGLAWVWRYNDRLGKTDNAGVRLIRVTRGTPAVPVIGTIGVHRARVENDWGK